MFYIVAYMLNYVASFFLLQFYVGIHSTIYTLLVYTVALLVLMFVLTTREIVVEVEGFKLSSCDELCASLHHDVITTVTRTLQCDSIDWDGKKEA